MRHGFIGYGNVIRAIHRALKKEEANTFGYYSKTNSHKGLEVFPTLPHLVRNTDVIWLGVKPQNIDCILEDLRKEDLKDKLIVSVVAGKSIQYINERLTSGSVIRIMTNLAIEFGHSVTAYASNNIDNPHKEAVRKTLENTGVLVEIPEKDFNLFTAVFGSGPAFLLKFIDIMKTKMADSGIDDSDLNTMLTLLLSGTSHYFKNYCNELSIDKLIENIASKGGTTEAGINYMIENNVEMLFDNVIEIAQNRAYHL
ncbi:MAG: pyrroline-5-carboxylate reductase family protein [Bacteroidales bacterium]